MALAPLPWFLYLLECRDGSLYAGISTDVQARFATHQAGRGARYTRSRPPLRILAVREYADRAAASRAEWQLKQQPRARKLAWMAEPAGDAAVPGASQSRQGAGTPAVPVPSLEQGSTLPVQMREKAC